MVTKRTDEKRKEERWLKQYRKRQRALRARQREENRWRIDNRRWIQLYEQHGMQPPRHILLSPAALTEELKTMREKENQRQQQ
jgi:hypothetical protein